MGEVSTDAYRIPFINGNVEVFSWRLSYLPLINIDVTKKYHHISPVAQSREFDSILVGV